MEPESRIIEYQGTQFTVSMTNVTAGMLYQVGKDWLDQADERVT